ncbi:MAG: ABC transporter permease [Actinomycetaceae bacterium]|nr:ABC transporter permease [Actinomycetaceae bacterium]
MVTIKRFCKLLGPPVLSAIFLLIVWETSVKLLQISEHVLPAPSAIWHAALEDRQQLGIATFITIKEGGSGLLLAVVVGIVVAAILYAAPSFNQAVHPLLIITQTIPLIAVAPLMIIWFGFGIGAKILVVALYGFFPITIATMQGLRETPIDLVNVARTWGCSPLWIGLHIRGRYLLPYFFSGLRIAATYTFGTAAVAEFVGARNGLGIYILSAQSSFRTDLVFVGAFTLAIITLILFGAVVGLQQYVNRYQLFDSAGVS